MRALYTTVGAHLLFVLTQVAPLDLSGVDLSKPSDQKLRVEHRWTIYLILKLAVPVLISMVCDKIALGSVFAHIVFPDPCLSSRKVSCTWRNP